MSIETKQEPSPHKRIKGIHLLLVFTSLCLPLPLHCLALSVVFLLALVRDHIAVGPKGREDIVGSFYEQNQSPRRKKERVKRKGGEVCRLYDVK